VGGLLFHASHFPDVLVDFSQMLQYACTVQFDQHAEFRRQLLDTGSARIVFVSDADNFLGSGCDAEELATLQTYGGKNWLGKSLMKLRNTLQDQVLVY